MINMDCICFCTRTNILIQTISTHPRDVNNTVNYMGVGMAPDRYQITAEIRIDSTILWNQWQLVNHLDKNGLYEVFQSAYRQLHSTETALLRVQNDILQAVDSRGGAILVLLNLSAAFDTIDHEKLIRTLDSCCGIKRDSLKWFLPCSICTNRIYFFSRTKSVVWCSPGLSPGASIFHNLHNPSW